MGRRLRRTLLGALVIVIGLAAVIQVVPYGRAHTTPPVRQEPPWDSPETRALAVRACFDCHSNQTRWPWYSHVAPVSWLIQADVDAGRRKLNYSEWHRPQEEAAESAEAVEDAEMPPSYYALVQAKARLTAAERTRLAAGLARTFGREEDGDRRERRERR